MKAQHTFTEPSNQHISKPNLLFSRNVIFLGMACLVAFAFIIASVALVLPVLAIYPGSFDPITLGHLDIIERGCKLFEQVVVAVLRNPNKSPLFTVAERIEQIRRSTNHLSNLEVDSFDGLTVNYARIRHAQVLLRGLRVLSDFEMELQMAHTNKTLSDQIETVFLATSNEYSFLSSSLVKEIARFGGPIDHLVPHHVAPDIYRCYAKTHPALPLTTDLTLVPEPPKMEPPVENR